MYQRILVSIDGSATSQAALRSAIGLARTHGARLHLVHLLESVALLGAQDRFGGYSATVEAIRETGSQLLDDAMKAVREAGVTVDSELLDRGERLGDAVAKAAQRWKADLIVAGTHGRRGASRFLMGSGAEQIVRDAPVTTLVVRVPSEG